MPQLRSSSLIYLGQLADDNCKIYLDKNNLVSTKNDNIVLTGQRNSIDGLWNIPVQKSTTTKYNYPVPTSHPSLYLSRTSPQPSSSAAAQYSQHAFQKNNKNTTNLDILILQ